MSWLIFDMHYLCHRNFHALGSDMTHAGVQTSVVFGVMRDVVSLMDRFQTTSAAFCFDADTRSLHRMKLLPTYKGKRLQKKAEAPEEEKLARKELERQIELLHSEYLPSIGYENIYRYEGFEADDLIASLVKYNSKKEITIIASDEDLWQLIGDNVSVWNPHKNVLTTLSNFHLAYGIEPRDWRKVKAIAGCSSDDVPGVPGAGEIRALRFLKGELGKKSKIYKKIKESGDIIKRNVKLTTLPFAGTPRLPLHEDHPTWDGWEQMCRAIGASSLLSQSPANIRRPRTLKRYQSAGFGL